MDHYDNTEPIRHFKVVAGAFLSAADLAFVVEAAEFSGKAHAAKLEMRRHEGGVYLWHPVEVAILVTGAGLGRAAIAAALNHDVVENTATTAEDVGLALGHEVMLLVEGVTDPVKMPGENRRAYKDRVRLRLSGMGSDVQSIRTADMITNVPSIVVNDPEFARVYVPEKVALLESMPAAHSSLRARAELVLRDGKASLERMGLKLKV